MYDLCICPKSASERVNESTSYELPGMGWVKVKNHQHEWVATNHQRFWKQQAKKMFPVNGIQQQHLNNNIQLSQHVSSCRSKSCELQQYLLCGTRVYSRKLVVLHRLKYTNTATEKRLVGYRKADLQHKKKNQDGNIWACCCTSMMFILKMWLVRTSFVPERNGMLFER